MKPALLLTCLAAAASQAYDIDMSPPDLDFVFSNPSVSTDSDFRIPTSYESAVMGRRILALSKLGHLSTVFPPSSSSSLDSEDQETQDWRRPPGLDGVPIGMMDYVADCEADGLGNPTVLAFAIATSFQNARAGSNISLSMRWTPPHPPAKRMSTESSSSLSFFDHLRGLLGFSPSTDADGNDDGDDHDTVPYSAANLPRLSILGYVETFQPDSDEESALASCFVNRHPDARYWLPGNRIHRCEWARIVVQAIYFVGGFGDRAYIGWIPVDQWQKVTREEWEAIRLPGEKEGWNEWSVDGAWAPSDL
ncbi:hypothetical protein ACRALDRAFT_2052073 [Sodiomyces alcalophilus JCM 7366]|uniref:uncharacterized protein n=1 Tax=Sodiomyces alcalophilus JCM 7366 TaxID=591952 RepID=UPI0039B53AA8